MSKERLDIRAARDFSRYSRSTLKKQIEDGKISINGVIIKDPNFQVSESDKIDLEQESRKIKYKPIEIPVIYEDSQCIVINKPAGVLAHSKGGFNDEQTVATWLAARLKSSKTGNRDGIVHRLDRATSGVMICAKNEATLKWLQKQFSTRKVVKTYYALVRGVLEPKSAIIDMPIERNPKHPQRFRVGPNGKSAITTYETEKVFDLNGENFSLLKLMPKTGRTHQLRVHLAYLKHPIIGDTFYNGNDAPMLYLHAHLLTITLLDKQRRTFEAKLPHQFLKPELYS